MSTKKTNTKSISGISENLQKSIDKTIIAEQGLEIKSRRLNRFKIGISISESEELSELGLSEIHQQDAMIEFARYLLVQGAHLVYGGDLRNKGYTFLFSELAFQYRSRTEQDKKHFTNYFSFPIHLRLSQSHLSEFKKNRVEVVKVPPAAGLNVDESLYIEPTSPENKIIWARSLSRMRQEMDKNTDARVFIGGKLLNYLGKYPGIIEEAFITLTSNKPIYLIGGFGGAAKSIISSLKGETSISLTEKFQSQNTEYAVFKELYNQMFNSDKIDYKSLNIFLKGYGLKKLCKNNGLTKEENERLFTTLHIPEMVYLVIKGLNNILSR